MEGKKYILEEEKKKEIFDAELWPSLKALDIAKKMANP